MTSQLLEDPSVSPKALKRQRLAEQRAKKQQRRSSNKSGPPAAPQAPTLVQFTPKSAGQRRWCTALSSNRLAFGIGPAGTGKTLLAVSEAVDLLAQGDVDKIILTRPAVEAGEKLGFLPGGEKDKLDPYLRPLYDAILEKLGSSFVAQKQLDSWLKSKQVEIAPLGFVRGRTFKRAVIIGDEMQNATYTQLKMLLTRLGEGSYMFVTGDETQSDIPNSRLTDVLERIEAHGRYPVIRLTETDVMRDPIVADLVRIL